MSADWSTPSNRLNANGNPVTGYTPNHVPAVGHSAAEYPGSATAGHRRREREHAFENRSSAGRAGASSHKKDSWLMGDPVTWRGRKIRSRRTGAVYVVRQVYRTGRVELEKSWMTYFSNVENIREEYESYL
jgi:hypothetical protein